MWSFSKVWVWSEAVRTARVCTSERLPPVALSYLSRIDWDGHAMGMTSFSTTHRQAGQTPGRPEAIWGPAVSSIMENSDDRTICLHQPI